MAETNRRKRVLTNVLYWAAIAAVVFLVFKYFIGLIWPFFVAFAFSLILRPLVRFLTEKWHMRYSLAAALCLILFFIVVGGVMVVISIRLITLASDTVSTIPGLYTRVIEPSLEKLVAGAEELATKINPSVYDMVSSAFPNVVSSIGSAVTDLSMKAVSAVSGWVTKLPRNLLSALICVIATVFMTIDFPRMSAFVMRQIPARTRVLVRETLDSVKAVVVRFGKSYLLIMGITFAEILLGLLIIRQKNAVLIAVAIAVFDLFPIVGAGLILLPWAIFTFMAGSIAKGAGLLSLWVIVIIVRQIIEPRIVGHSVGLHPLVTLMSMFVGTKLFGGVGLFGLPISCAVVKALDDGGIIHIIKKEDPVPVPETEESEKKSDLGEESG